MMNVNGKTAKKEAKLNQNLFNFISVREGGEKGGGWGWGDIVGCYNFVFGSDLNSY